MATRVTVNLIPTSLKSGVMDTGFAVAITLFRSKSFETRVQVVDFEFWMPTIERDSDTRLLISKVLIADRRGRNHTLKTVRSIDDVRINPIH
jgi:hypothetical protein